MQTEVLDLLKQKLQEIDPGKSVHVRCNNKLVYESFLKGLLSNSKDWLKERNVRATQAEDKKYYIEIEFLSNQEAVTIAKGFMVKLKEYIDMKLLEIVYRDLNPQ